MNDQTVVPGGAALLSAVAPGAVRRTLTLQIDPRGDWRTGSTISAVGRDLAHLPDGEVRVHEERFWLELDSDDLIQSNASGDVLPEGLIGTSAKRGLRKRIIDLRAHGMATELGEAGSLRDALVDDVPGLIVVGGYGRLYDKVVEGPSDTQMRGPASQVCVGFNRLAESGEGFSTTRFLDKEPIAEFVSGDPMAWHDDVEMPVGAIRRRRLLEVAPGAGVFEVRGYFRDTFCRPDGVEVVIHEYGLSATVAGDPLSVESLTAHPGKLPMEYCPMAAVGAQDVAGAQIDSVDGIVRTTLLGPRSCTHLNDELRSLRLVPTLVGQLSPQ